jgi:hypothetical protein
VKNDVVEHRKQIIALALNAGGMGTVTNFVKEKIGNGKVVF